MDILVGQKQGKMIQLTQLESHFEDGVVWSNTSKQKVVADMKMTELNFLLSFFIYGTVRSYVKVGLIESEETFFRVFFFRYKNVLIAQYGSINTLKNYIQCYKPIALVAAC